MSSFFWNEGIQSFAVEVWKIKPEYVQFLRFSDFRLAYDQHVELHSVNRDGTPPEFFWTVRPGLQIQVEGFSTEE